VQNPARRAVSWYLGIGRAVSIVSTPSAWKPGSVASMRHNARTSKPAETSSTTQAATSPITSTERSRSLCPPPARAPSRSALKSDWRHARSAGNTPKPTPVRQETSAAKISTRTSIDGACAMGSEAGTNRVSKRTAPAATSTPAAPPVSASTRLSVISWRTRRSRPAPMAVRTASSRCRANPRAINRFARFAQAISSTQSAAPLSAISNNRDCCDTSSRSRFTVAPVCRFSRGNCLSSCAAITPISARACSSDTPGFRRASTFK